MKDHIESITNGNSKRLAYWIATGVIALVLNFALGTIEIVANMNQPQPKDILVKVEYLTEAQKLEAATTQNLLLTLIELKQISAQILKEAEKMQHIKYRDRP